MRRNAAFSLIEVMCAMLILGIGLAGLAMGVSTALSSNKESELQTTAAMIAAGQMEMLQANRDLVDGDEEGDCGAQLPLYHWRQSISSAPIAGLHEVQVTIGNSRTGETIYELKTLLFDPNTVDAQSKAGRNRSRRNAGRGGNQ